MPHCTQSARSGGKQAVGRMAKRDRPTQLAIKPPHGRRPRLFSPMQISLADLEAEVEHATQEGRPADALAAAMQVEEPHAPSKAPLTGRASPMTSVAGRSAATSVDESPSGRASTVVDPASELASPRFGAAHAAEGALSGWPPVPSATGSPPPHHALPAPASSGALPPLPTVTTPEELHVQLYVAYSHAQALLAAALDPQSPVVRTRTTNACMCLDTTLPAAPDRMGEACVLQWRALTPQRI